MDDHRWKQIERVYLAALDAPDRAVFLDETCSTDPELRIAVALLLTQEPSTVSLLGQLALQGSGTSSAPYPIACAPLAPDSQFGPYRIVEMLGSGGSSDVYKAQDPRLGRFVALKVFDGTRVTEEFRSRFARESRAAASLNHPNIATVYEVGEADRAWFIAMEFIDGMTLRDAFNNPACSLRQRLQYLAQAASGVARAHASGMAHCDLKPDNIMVTRDGLVKVLDFGLARLTGSSDVDGARLEGTIGYMSPEQAAGRSIDGRSDIFSFGCMLFEAVTGRLPFPTTRWLESLMQAPTPRLEPQTQGAPDGLQSLIDACLVKNPVQRLSSLEEVSLRLQTILQAPSRLRRWSIAAAVAAVIVVSAIAYWQWPTPPPPGSVAVIPFASAGSTPDGRELAETVSEGIINALAQLEDLKVIARTSSFRFGTESLDVPAVARTLGVQTLVVGRVVVTKGQLAINAELVNGADGRLMWGSEYTPSLAGSPNVETQIAREIARRVRSRLTPTDQRRLDKTVHPNAEAYSSLLRGRYEMSLYTLPSARRAADHFKQALGIDSNYALANAELANAYRRLTSFGDLKPEEALRSGEQAALKALRIDEELPEAHAALAGIYRDRWQWMEAEREYRRAIELSPSFGPARQALAIGLTITGQADAAIEEIVRARELDPVGLPGAIESAAVFYNLRLYDRALATLMDAASFAGLAPELWTWVGIASGGKRDFTGAVKAFERAIDLEKPTTSTRCYYVHALARAGRREDAMRELRALQRSGEVVGPSFLAIAYLGLGDREAALKQLEAGFKHREPLMQYIVVESYLDEVMNDPRFQKIVAGMGLAPARRS